jgi:hypothetical protein
MIPAIDEWWFTVGGRQLYGPRLLQDVSSLLGLVFVGWLLWRALRAPSPIPVGRRLLPSGERHAWCWIYVLTAVAVSTADLFLVRSNEPFGLHTGGPVAHVAIAGLRGLAVAVLAVSVVLSLRLRRFAP